MTIRRPSKEELEELARDAGISLNEEELDDYTTLAAGILDQLEAVQEMPEPQFAPEEVRYDSRDPGYRPGDDEDPYNVWITKCDARGADSGPLAGKTVGLKDTISLAGVELTCGSHLLEGYVPTVDATVVRRLLDAGADIVGKTNMESFSFSSLSSISDFGTVRNPSAPGYIAGGSSSGSGAAVAAGEVDIAIGTDQGGSIRMPASMCGVVGIKPTWGLVPFTGVFPIDNTVDHVGPMASTVEECAETLEAITGPDGLDPRQPSSVSIDDYTSGLSQEIEDMTIAVLEEGFEQEQHDDEVNAVVWDTIAELETLGATVEEVSIDNHYRGPTLWSAIGGYGGLQVFRQGGMGSLFEGWYNTELMEVFEKFRKARARDFPPTVKAMWLAWAYTERQYGSSLYGKAQNLTRELRAEYDTVLEDADAIAMPTVPVKPFEIQEDQDRVERIAESGLVPLGANTCPFNLTHHPALSVPCGTMDDLPAGLMLVGSHFDDKKLLQIGHAFENR
jgi:amidase